MLDSIRKRTNGFIYTVIILAIVAVMALYGVGQMNKPQGEGGAAAWVNGDMISQGEFQQELERRMYQYKSLLGGQFDDRFLAQFQIPQRTLNDLVQFKLFAQQAKKLGIIVTDYELASYIRTVPYYQKDGKFDAEGYSKLPNRGVQEKIQRERLQVAKFQEYLADRIRLTPAAVRRSYDLKETKVDLDYAKIDFKEVVKGAQPTAKQMDDFIKNTPTTEIEAYYSSHRKDYTQPASVQLRQIRVGIPFQASAAQKAEAKKKIDAVAKEVTAANFAQVAKTKSDDEYAKKGGEVGWVNRGTLDPGLESALDKLEVGKVSEPVETTFGYFLVLAEKKKDEVVKPLTEVKKSIGEKILHEKVVREAAEEKRKEWEKVLSEGKPLEPLLKAAKIEVKKTGPFAVGQGNIPNVGAAENMVDGIFELSREKPVAKKLYVFHDNYYYMKLRSFEPAKEADYAKNREAVEKGIVTALQSEVVGQWGQALTKNATIKTEVRFDNSGPETMVQ